MGRVDWHQVAVRFGARAGLPARAQLVLGTLAVTAGMAIAGSAWLTPAPGNSPPAPTIASERDRDGAEPAQPRERLVLAQLGSDGETDDEAPTLAEVIDLPIRRVATTRITLSSEEGAVGASETARDRPARPGTAPSPDLDVLPPDGPSATYPAPAARVPVRYASLPEADVPERFAIRAPRLPLLARLEVPTPLTGDEATWERTGGDALEPGTPDRRAQDPEATGALDAPTAARAQDATEGATGAADGAPEDVALASHAPPPPRPEGLPPPERRPEPQPAATTAPVQARNDDPDRERPRTLAGLLRTVLGGDAMPGVREGEDGETPTACLPEPLREILVDVAREFGPVALVSTETLNTRNHYAGSARHRFHRDCEAADFRVEADIASVVRWLRGRPNVGGVAAYRNGVIHVDLDRAVAARLRREAASR